MSLINCRSSIGGAEGGGWRVVVLLLLCLGLCFLTGFLEGLTDFQVIVFLRVLGLRGLTDFIEDLTDWLEDLDDLLEDLDDFLEDLGDLGFDFLVDDGPWFHLFLEM